jgi:hypothetical protein
LWQTAAGRVLEGEALLVRAVHDMLARVNLPLTLEQQSLMQQSLALQASQRSLQAELDVRIWFFCCIRPAAGALIVEFYERDFIFFYSAYWNKIKSCNSAWTKLMRPCNAQFVRLTWLICR